MAKHVLVGVTGSIAAYKAAELVRRLKAKELDVTVVMTEAATRFIGELTFRTLSRNPVAVDMFAERPEWVPEHVSLADNADAYVIAPCTANVLAKLAHGIADDLLTCTALAVKAPVIVAPAMNENMWTHPATQANLETLRSRDVTIVDAGSGDLACGYQGKGRMASLDDIMSALESRLEVKE